MTLAELQQAVRQLFPSAIYGPSYTAAVDASGNATIALWNNTLGAQPTDTALSDALAASQLATAKAQQEEALVKAYSAARWGTPVSITSGSTTLTFPTDTATQTNVAHYLSVFRGMATLPGSVPLADSGGVVQSITPAQVQSYAEAVLTQSTAAFQKLSQLLGQVKAATTVADVEAVVWS